MELWLIGTLVAAVFGASLLQAATGIGYGVIAGPVFLVALNGSEAIQISTIHNLLIALMLAPGLRADIERGLLAYLCIGAVIGIAVGLTLQSIANVVVLKLSAAAMVSFVAVTLYSDMKIARSSQPQNPGPIETASVGSIAGVMGGMLAMPGPLAATWMSVRQFGKRTVRSTILTFFVFAYGANAIFYAVTGRLNIDTLMLVVYLTPALLVGVYTGARIARYLTERVFRSILLVVLVCTVLMLTLSIF